MCTNTKCFHSSKVYVDMVHTDFGSRIVIEYTIMSVGILNRQELKKNLKAFNLSVKLGLSFKSRFLRWHYFFGNRTLC